MKITLVQTEVSINPWENLATASDAVHLAANEGSSLIAFPETFMARLEKGMSAAEIAEPSDGPFVSGLAELAEQYDIAIVCGVWQKIEDEKKRAANSVVVLGRDGGLRAEYRKIHLFDALNVNESEQMVAGSLPPPLFTCDGIRFGLAICYDLRFPELFRHLALQGAEAVVVPAAWYGGVLKEDHWLTLLRSRAIENTLYLAGVNQCSAPFCGRSTVFDPFGVMLAGAGETEALVSVNIDKERLEDIRARLPALKHIRRGLFFG
ncbi:carbon-nitrogen hydrolase family protein [Desulfomarina sp.]